jgi:hypothetical protein
MQDYWKLDYKTVCMILENYHDLSTGARLGGSDGNPESQKTGNVPHGPQEEMGMLCATVCHRVRKCGLDGMLVEERYGLNYLKSPKLEEQIAEERLIKLSDVFSRINKVIWYCVGRRAKRDEQGRPLSYEDWKVTRKYRRKEPVC